MIINHPGGEEMLVEKSQEGDVGTGEQKKRNRGKKVAYRYLCKEMESRMGEV